MTNKQIQNNLKECRNKTGLTQQQVAEKLEFKSTNRICRWEKGKAYPSIPNLFKLGQIYGVAVEEFYEGVIQNIKDEALK
jgi:transcriptional regulator with XRE-family HTH domain